MRPPVGKIKVLYRDYELAESGVEDADCRAEWGSCNYTDGRILYAPGQDRYMLPNTLTHEQLHALTYEMGLAKYMRDEESVVNYLTNGLIAVWRDNPALWWFIMDLVLGSREGAVHERAHH